MPAPAIRSTIRPSRSQSMSSLAEKGVTWTPEMPASAALTVCSVMLLLSSWRRSTWIADLHPVLEGGLHMLPRRAHDVIAHVPFGGICITARKRLEDGAMLAQRTNPLRRIAENELTCRVIVDALSDQDTLQIAAT